MTNAKSQIDPKIEPITEPGPGISLIPSSPNKAIEVKTPLDKRDIIKPPIPVLIALLSDCSLLLRRALSILEPFASKYSSAL